MLTKKIWWQFTQYRKWNVAGILAIGLLHGYFTILLPLSIGKYMEILFSSGTGKTRALQLLGVNLPDSISIFFLFFLCCLLLKFFSNWVYDYQSSMFGESFVNILRNRLYTHHLKQKKTTGKIHTSALLAYTNDSKLLRQLLVKGVLGFTKDLLLALMGLYVLFLLNTVLTLIVSAAVVLFYFIQRWYNQKQKHTFVRKRSRQASLLNYVSKTIFSDTTSMQDNVVSFYKKSLTLQEALKSYHLSKSLLRALAPFMLYGMLAVIMWAVVWGIGKDEMHVGDVLAYMLLLITLFPVIRNLIKIEHTWMQGELAALKFYRACSPADEEINNNAEQEFAEKGFAGSTSK